jgi:murein L,D-transpeptidase YafK
MTLQDKISKIIYLSLLFIIIDTSIYAQDILTNYRNNGIYSIKEQLDKQLYSKKYWDEYLKNIDTKFGYIEKYTNLLICDKSKSTLSLYMIDKNNKYILTKEYDAFTGKVSGDKVKEGDLRTPVGVYDILAKRSNVDSFYGPMAFVTSYPNLYDKYNKKDGHGIWIHGRPMNNEKRDTFTKGCIAIKNKNIECLDRNINIDKTVLIIHETNKNQVDNKAELTILLSELFKWRYSWIYNDINTYLNFYSQDFIRYDGMKYNTFKNYKKRIFNKNEKKTIKFTNINIIKYPNTQNLYRITFHEAYRAPSFTFSGNKTLMVKLENNNMKIITEK